MVQVDVEKSFLANIFFEFVYTNHNYFFFCFKDQITLEGMVVQRAECRPAVSESYMKLKK